MTTEKVTDETFLCDEDLGTTEAESGHQKMTLYRRRDAIGLRESHAMDEVVMPDAAALFMGKFDTSALGDGAFTEMVFQHSGPEGYSIVRAWFAPGYLLPRHSHDADCTYYVTSGELRLGSQVLGAGEGFFVPKDRPYSYEAGPEGVEVLEFRHATTFNIRFVDEQEERWQRVFDVANRSRQAWREMRAERIRSAV